MSCGAVDHYHLIPTLYPLCFALFLLHGRSSAMDYHELNEDGELWLVYEGLKQANRLYLCPQNAMLFICCFSY